MFPMPCICTSPHLSPNPLLGGLSPIALCREAERMASMKHGAGLAAGGPFKDWKAMNKRNMDKANKFLNSNRMQVNSDRLRNFQIGLPIAEWCL